MAHCLAKKSFILLVYDTIFSKQNDFIILSMDDFKRCEKALKPLLRVGNLFYYPINNINLNLNLKGDIPEVLKNVIEQISAK